MNYIIAGEQGLGKTMLARKIANKLKIMEITLDEKHWERNLVSTHFDCIIIDECTQSQKDLTKLKEILRKKSVTARPYYGKEFKTVDMPTVIVCIQGEFPELIRGIPNTIVIRISSK